MSPHIEYWGIPSPTEEVLLFPLAGDGGINGENLLQCSNRLFVLSVDCDDEDADFIPESFE